MTDLNHSALVLLHGLYSTPDELLALKTPLRRAGATVISLEIKGYTFDANEKKPISPPFEDWVIAVQSQVKDLRAQGFQKVFLAGISTGAALALASVMADSPACDGVILMSTSLVQDGWSIPIWHKLMPLAIYTPLGIFWRYRESPPYGVKNERIRAWIARELTQRKISRAGVSSLSHTHLKENDRLNRYVKKNLSAVSCPAILALHAQEDEIASTHNLTILASGLSSVGISLQTIILKNSYHMISIDNDRQQVIDASLNFLKTHTGHPNLSEAP